MSESPGDRITDGAELGTVDAGLTPFDVALRARGALPAFVVSVLVSIGGFSLWDADGALGVLAFLASIVGTLAALATIGLTFTFAPAAYYQGRISHRFPGARVVTTETGLWLADASHVLLGTPRRVVEPQGARARLQSYLVMTPEGISFWSRDGLQLRPFLAIPSSRIRGISNGFSNPRTSSKGSFAMIHIVKDDGDEYPLSFTPQAPRFLGVMRTVVWQETIVKWMTEQY